MNIKLNHNGKEKYTKLSLKIEEKIELFERYLKETGKPIIVTTTYKGYPIGRHLIDLRSGLNTGKTKIDEKNMNKLIELGLLGKRHSSIDEKIEKLAEFCMNHKEEWDKRGSKDTEKSKELIKVLRYYDYILRRRIEGKLSKEQIEKLKIAGIGGVIGRESEVTELSSKYNISIKTLENIVTEFGSINQFREKYINYLINGESEEGKKVKNFLENSKIRLIDCFDINSPDLINRDENLRILYTDILKGNLDYRIPFVIDAKTAQETIEKLCDTRRAKIIIGRYGLEDGNKRTLDSFSKKYNLSKTRIAGLEEDGLEIIRNRTSDIKNMQLAENNRERFIRLFFKDFDVFRPIEIQEMDEEKRNELLSIINEAKQKYENISEEMQREQILKTSILDLDLSQRATGSLRKSINYKLRRTNKNTRGRY